jgi:hypothetical protein
MSRVQVANAQGEVIWEAPEIDNAAIDQVQGTIRVIDLRTSEVIAGFRLRPGDKVVKRDPN